MHARVMAAVVKTAHELDGGSKPNVRALCRQLGIAPKTFYKWANRYRREGLAGLEELSRRPHRSPTVVSPVMEDVIVELRKTKLAAGEDAGAASIRYQLCRDGTVRPPSEATIWRVMVRRGLVTPEPRKRPNRATRRFQAAEPNELWQIDATEWHLADGSRVEIVNLIDDHSRLCPASMAVITTTSEAAWAAFSCAVDRFGLPSGCLSDNGLAFSGKLRGYEVFFETQLRAAGVDPITSRPYHPQTCGKVERFQQTLKKWLRARPRAATLDELQAQLETFRSYYNRRRPHRALAMATPWERWSSTPRAEVGHVALASPQRRNHGVVAGNGTVNAGQWAIAVGADHAGRPAEVVVDGLHAAVFVDGRFVRDLEIDPGRRYQPKRTSRVA